MIDRISFVIASSVLGGGELYTNRLAEALSSMIDVRVVGGANTAVLEDAARKGLQTDDLKLGSKLSSRTALRATLTYPVVRKRFDQLIRESQRDLFVLQYKLEELIWAGRHNGERIAILEHGPVPAQVLKFSPTRKRFRASILEARSVLAASEPARESIRLVSGRDAELVLAGIDIEAARIAIQRRTAVRRELGIRSDQRALAVVGRVAEDKGIFKAIDVLRADAQCVLVVCGNGPDEKNARTAAEQYGVAKRMLWLGWRDDVYDVLGACDALLLLSSSHGEGRPLVALESLAVSTPVIGLSTTPALAAMADVPGVALANSENVLELVAAARSVIDASRPEPYSASWSDAAKRFLEVVEVAK